MSLYESIRTGERLVMDEARAAIYNPGVWKLVDDSKSTTQVHSAAAPIELQLSLDVEPRGTSAVVEDTAPTGKGK